MVYIIVALKQRLFTLNHLLKIVTLILAISSFFYVNTSWSVTQQAAHASTAIAKKITPKKHSQKKHHQNTHTKHNVKNPPAERVEDSDEVVSSAEQSTKTEKTTLATSHYVGFVAAVQQHVVDFVRNTVTTLRYSDYKLGGKKFDPARGVYVVDCSNFVDRVLQNVSPHAYTSLVNATGSDSPATQHYYDFFSELSDSNEGYWNKVNFVDDLRPGDILVFRYKNSRGRETGGHVMVVMGKPMRGDANIYYVRVADSANSGHSQDTRQRNEAGIGIGTLLLKVNPHTGRPAAYAWGVGSYWNNNVKVAMARPMDVELA